MPPPKPPARAAPAPTAASPAPSAVAQLAAAVELEAEAAAVLQPAPPQRISSPQYVADALILGDTSYGRRTRPTLAKGKGGIHTGVDELGFSTAWRSQPRPGK